MRSIVEKVHELEDEFGKIAKIPENEPRLLEIRKSLQNSTTHKPVKNPLTDEQKKEIQRLWEQNWLDSEISREMGLPLFLVSKIRLKLGKANKRVFTLKRGVEVEAFTSLSQVSYFLGFNSPRSRDEIQSRLKRDGWHMSERMTHDY